jgi:hypothetical protein
LQRWGESKRDEEPLIVSREMDATPVAGTKRALGAPQCFRSAASLRLDSTIAAKERREILSESWTGTEFASDLREPFFSPAVTPKAAVQSLQPWPQNPDGTVPTFARKHRRPAPGDLVPGAATKNQKLRKKPCEK